MSIKISVADVEAMALEDYDGDLTVVEIGDWVSEGKYESCEVIFTDGERYYCATAMRSGSYYSDYMYESEWNDGDADVEEVAKVAVVRTEWQPVLEYGYHVYETEYPELGSYCLSRGEFARGVAENGEDFYTIIEPAYRTESGWHASKLDETEAV